MKKGNIYSLTSYWTVKDVQVGGKIVLEDANGREAVANENALNEAFVSGDNFKTEEKINKTDLQPIILKNKNTAMTINFNKKLESKSKKQYEQDLLDQAELIKNKILTEGLNKVVEILRNPITDTKPIENRTMRGYHNSDNLNSNGLLDFIDMEAKDSSNKFILKQANISEIKWAIINDVKYTVK
jgi:hypothetical protein